MAFLPTNNPVFGARGVNQPIVGQQGSRLGRSLMAQAIQPRPIANPLQGLAQLAQAGLGAALTVRGERQQQEQQEARRQAIMRAFGLGGSQGQTMIAGIPSGPGAASGGVQPQVGAPGSIQPTGGQPSQLAMLLSSQDPQLQNLGMQMAMQQPATPKIQQIRQGEDFVTMRVYPDGRMEEISRSPIAASRPQTNVTVSGQKAQTEFAKSIAKSAAKLADNVQAAGEAAQTVDSSLDMFEQAMGAAEGGGLAEFKLGVGRIAQSLGIDPEKLGLGNVASLEAANAISNRLALAQVEQMKGALSNKELGFLQSQIPGISNTPEGRKKLISIMRVANKRARDRAEFVTDWLAANEGAKGPGFTKALRDYDRGLQSFDKEVGTLAQTGGTATEGTIIENDAGERMILRGGRWEPFNG